MISVDEPSVDWLTLTGVDRNSFVSLRLMWLGIVEGEVRRSNEIAKKSGGKYSDRKTLKVEAFGFKGYRGQIVADVFFGARQVKGAEEGVEEYIMRVSGWRSAMFVRMCRPDVTKWRSSRIDIQVTCEMGGVNMDMLERLMRGEGWKGRHPKIERVRGDNPDRSSTIYAGGRQSERFLRIYIKEDDEGYRYLRFELELKGTMAADAYGMIACAPSLGEQCGGILNWSMQKLPESCQRMLEAHVRALRDYEPEKLTWKKRGESNSTLTWLWEAVLPAIERLVNEGDNYSQMVSWRDTVNEIVRGDYNG